MLTRPAREEYSPCNPSIVSYRRQFLYTVRQEVGDVSDPRLPRRLVLFPHVRIGTVRSCGSAASVWKAPSMVLEVALVDVVPGQEKAFTAAYRAGHPILAGTPGCRSVRMTRGVESPTRVVLLVEWDSVEAHTENFRNTDRFTRWRALIGPHFAGPPQVEHYTDVPPEPA